jgi:hypothetical protein
MVGLVETFRAFAEACEVITKDRGVRYARLAIASVAILAVLALSNLIVNAVLRARYRVSGFYSVNRRPMHRIAPGTDFRWHC